PLRIEAQIFVGTVFAELQTVRFDQDKTSAKRSRSFPEIDPPQDGFAVANNQRSGIHSPRTGACRHGRRRGTYTGALAPGNSSSAASVSKSSRPVTGCWSGDLYASDDIANSEPAFPSV